MKEKIKNWVNKAGSFFQWSAWTDKAGKFLKSGKGIACMAAAGVLALAAAAWGGYEIWLSRQPKFHDLTIELGTDAVQISDFMTEYANAKKVAFVTDPAVVDLNRTGSISLVLRNGSAEETVTLTIEDTTAPTVTFASEYRVMADAGLPQANALVSDVRDASRVSISYLNEPVIPIDYRDETVTVVAEDESGNTTQGQCRLSFCWLRESYSLELGDTLTKEALLLNPERDEPLLDQAVLDEINAGGLGTYTVSSETEAKQIQCTVTVQDTKGPELVLRTVQRMIGKQAKLEDFVESVSDLSGVAEVYLVTELDVSTKGTYTVVVEAKDTCGNVTRAETTLWVTDDKNPPKIKGDLGTLTVEKHSSPDFLAGITAYDEVDGNCKVTCDTSSLNLDMAGTYYITYHSSDKSGNVRTVKRKVVVQHDAEDTAALVQSISDSLSNDPETIRDYVRRKISYNHEWGGDDPVWYGFTTHGGNCYVHAQCLKAIFDRKGIESRLIWVTNKTHYWLIVKIGDGWKHIDATPSRLHGKYSLMNDTQRLETLSGRVWDTTQWPACE